MPHDIPIPPEIMNLWQPSPTTYVQQLEGLLEITFQKEIG